MKNCLLPTLNGIQTMKMNYKGILFFGLMIKEEKCYILEYNVRMGDPETQSLLPLLKTDLVEIFEKTLDDDLDSLSIDWLNEFSTTVVMASGGYPDEYEKGFEISFDESYEDKSTKIFFSGVSKSGNGKMVTDGGRVLSVTSIDKNKLNSIKKSYERINNIKFKGAFYRKDIGINTEE
jgi:phosphoribosylamine-glycine ligase